jgi:uncharacterized protein YecT (DUF1311 family)
LHQGSTMRRIKALFAVVCLIASATNPAETRYGGQFDYMQFKTSAEYFAGHTSKQIAQLCAAGERASIDDLEQCAHREYEQANTRLEMRIKKSQAFLERNDTALEKNHQEPLAIPYFSKSQQEWTKYRDNQCYGETYMLGAASERYINFWECMTRITQARIKEVDTSMKR